MYVCLNSMHNSTHSIMIGCPNLLCGAQITTHPPQGPPATAPPKSCAQIFWGSRPNRAPKFWGVPPKSCAQIIHDFFRQTVSLGVACWGPAQIVRPNYSCIFSTNGEPWGGMLDAPKYLGTRFGHRFGHTLCNS